MQLRLIDSHCHINTLEFQEDADEVIRRSLDADIAMNVLGTDLDSSRRAIELAQRYDGVYASVGLHPSEVMKEDFDFKIYSDLAKQDKVVAIGEIGLDYFRLAENSLEKVKAAQRDVFIEQVKLARGLNLPIVIHTRATPGKLDAYEDLLEIINSSVKGVLHSFGGTLEYANKFIELGFYLGFNGIITFKKAQEIRDLVQQIPLDRILVETDSPYLAPEPHRGQRNEPSYVRYIAEKIAAIKNITLERVAKQTIENAKKLFNL